MTRLFVLAVLSVVVLSLAACGGGAGGQQSGSPPEGNGTETSAEAPEGGGSGGEDASGVDTEQASSSGKDFSVTTLEDERFVLSEKRGEVVALFFMAGY